MKDPDITLYHCPGACSRVTVCALEMAKLPYTLELINIPKGEQSTPEYLAIYALGKVPYAIIDGVGLSENLAILTYIASLRPESDLFPVINTPRDRAEIIGGMSFCSGTLHPIVRGIRNPKRMTTTDEDGVREMSMKLARKSFSYAEDRIKERKWWLGEPSIVDVYLDWAFQGALIGGFDRGVFSSLEELNERLKEIPAYLAMMEEEKESSMKMGL